MKNGFLSFAPITSFRSRLGQHDDQGPIHSQWVHSPSRIKATVIQWSVLKPFEIFWSSSPLRNIALRERFIHWRYQLFCSLWHIPNAALRTSQSNVSLTSLPLRLSPSSGPRRYPSGPWSRNGFGACPQSPLGGSLKCIFWSLYPLFWYSKRVLSFLKCILGIRSESREYPQSDLGYTQRVLGVTGAVWRIPTTCLEVPAACLGVPTACFGSTRSVVWGYWRRLLWVHTAGQGRIPTAGLEGTRSGLDGTLSMFWGYL